METNTIKKIATNDKRELVSRYNSFINELINDVNNKTYMEEGKEYKTYSFTNNPGMEITELDFKDVGVRMLKRFKRYLNQVMAKRNVDSINKLFHLVHSKILKQPTYPKLVCEKHNKIQKLRKEWKKQQIIDEQLLMEYKKEKGDFYKNDLKF